MSMNVSLVHMNVFQLMLVIIHFEFIYVPAILGTMSMVARYVLMSMNVNSASYHAKACSNTDSSFTLL